MLGPLGSNNHASNDIHAVDFSLDSLKAEASTFARIALKDAEARATYVRRIAGMAAQIRGDVLQGRITAEQGCRFANEMRNVIMNETRAITSALARAAAETAKRTGLTLEAALEKAVKQLYPGKTFADLSTDQKRSIFMEVIDASGRSSPKFTRLIPILDKLGKGLIVVTVAISAYNIWAAKNRVKATITESATISGGFVGGALGTAAAGFACGPGAPVCVGALFIIGGIVGAWGARQGAEWVLDQREVNAWLDGY